MTKPRFYNKFDAKEFYSFSDWVRQSLPDSYSNTRAYDVDKVIYNLDTKKIMFIEEKRLDAEISEGQRQFCKFMSGIVRRGLPKGWEFLGYHFIQFPEKNVFDCNGCKVDGKPMSMWELREFLTF